MYLLLLILLTLPIYTSDEFMQIYETPNLGKYLEQNKPDLTKIVDDNGNTLLHKAVDKSNKQYFRTIIFYGPTLPLQPNKEGLLPIHVIKDDASLATFTNALEYDETTLKQMFNTTVTTENGNEPTFVYILNNIPTREFINIFDSLITTYKKYHIPLDTPEICTFLNEEIPDILKSFQPSDKSRITELLKNFPSCIIITQEDIDKFKQLLTSDSVETIRDFIQKHPGIATKELDTFGNTPFHYVAQNTKSALPIIQYLAHDLHLKITKNKDAYLPSVSNNFKNLDKQTQEYFLFLEDKDTVLQLLQEEKTTYKTLQPYLENTTLFLTEPLQDNNTIVDIILISKLTNDKKINLIKALQDKHPSFISHNTKWHALYFNRFKNDYIKAIEKGSLKKAPLTYYLKYSPLFATEILQDNKTAYELIKQQSPVNKDKDELLSILATYNPTERYKDLAHDLALIDKLISL